jgi:hypothetical protein
MQLRRGSLDGLAEKKSLELDLSADPLLEQRFKSFGTLLPGKVRFLKRKIAPELDLPRIFSKRGHAIQDQERWSRSMSVRVTLFKLTVSLILIDIMGIEKASEERSFS